jgi:hypothetical protein
MQLIRVKMGIFKDSLKVINECVTLGGAGRLAEARRSFQEKYNEYIGLYKEANGYQIEIEENIKAMGDALTNAKPYLEISEKIIKHSVNDTRGLNVEFGTKTLNKVEMFNSEFNTAINVGAGSIAGGSLAVGSWALVTALGSASTGAAISGLSGVAAANATLAWFGGGALAAGGAGMAGGMAILGGIVAVPMVYFAAKGSHKKAKEAEEAKTKVVDAISQIRKQIEILPLSLAIVKARKYEITKLCYDLISDILKLMKIIRPHGGFSMVKQKVLSLLKKNPYTQEQSDALAQLNQSIARFVTGFRTSGESGKNTEMVKGINQERLQDLIVEAHV